MICSCSCLGSGCVGRFSKDNVVYVRSFNGVVLLILLFKKIKRLMVRIGASKIALRSQFAYALRSLQRKLRSCDTQYFAGSVNDKLFFYFKKSSMTQKILSLFSK